MKKFLAMLLAAMMVLCCASAMAEAKTELIVGTNPEFQPFEYMDDNGNVIGFDADLVAELEKDLGVTMTFEAIDFNSIVPGIATGKYDLGISGFYINEERLESVDFSIPYLEDSQSCIVKVGGTVTDAESLMGKTIGSQTGTVGMESAATMTDEDKVLGYANPSLAIQELAGGKLDAVITDTPVAKRILKELNDETLMILDAVEFDKEYYAVALPKGSDELKAQIDASITRMIEDGTIDALVVKWDVYGENADAE